MRTSWTPQERLRATLKRLAIDVAPSGYWKDFAAHIDVSENTLMNWIKRGRVSKMAARHICSLFPGKVTLEELTDPTG